jgi:hypothetical protein
MFLGRHRDGQHTTSTTVSYALVNDHACRRHRSADLVSDVDKVTSPFSVIELKHAHEPLYRDLRGFQRRCDRAIARST